MSTPKEVREGIDTIKESLELNGLDPTDGIVSTLIHYLESNIDDIVEASDDFDFDEDEELF